MKFGAIEFYAGEFGGRKFGTINFGTRKFGDNLNSGAIKFDARKFGAGKFGAINFGIRKCDSNIKFEYQILSIKLCITNQSWLMRCCSGTKALSSRIALKHGTMPRRSSASPV